MRGNIEVPRSTTSNSSFSFVIELPIFGTNLVKILRITVISTSFNLIYVLSCSVGMVSKQIKYIFSGLFFCIICVLFGVYNIVFCCLFFMLVSVDGLRPYTLSFFFFFFKLAHPRMLRFCCAII